MISIDKQNALIMPLSEVLSICASCLLHCFKLYLNGKKKNGTQWKILKEFIISELNLFPDHKEI